MGVWEMIQNKVLNGRARLPTRLTERQHFDFGGFLCVGTSGTE